MRKATLAVMACASAAFVLSEPSPRVQVGPLESGAFLLNTGWVLRPAGRQVETGTLPMSMALSPDGAWLLTLNGGYAAPTVSVIETARGIETARVRITDGWLGLLFSPGGDKVYVGGGADASVLEMNFAGGGLTPSRRFPTPAGTKTADDFVGDVALSPDGATLYAALLYRNSIAAIDLASGAVKSRFATGARPYRIRVRPDGQSLLVTGWGDATLYHHDAASGRILARIRVGAHPTDMVFRGDGLFVAAANTNLVYGLEPFGGSWRVAEQIDLSLAPRQPKGMTPSAMALSADWSRVYVACSDANAVAVLDVGGDATRVLGFVPVGWYPTAVAELSDGRLAVANGKGGRSYANPKSEYVASLQKGSLSLIDSFDGGALEGYTAEVLRNSPYRDDRLDDAGVPPGNPVPTRPGEPSPIRHVLYIIRENRTYDQVLGDMPEGAGDPSLTLFGRQVTPNAHKLAREFVLFDNFYVNADVSAGGHQWSTAAISPDYVEKLWPLNYAGRSSKGEYGPGPAATAAAGSPNGYLWTLGFGAGLSMRSYGYTTGEAQFRAFTSPDFKSWDLDYPDTDRARVFVRELAQFEQAGELPRFMIMHLGRDHTSGATSGKHTPAAMVADNDYALGLIVEAMSRSRFWGSAAIFVLEDDAQNGPDHIDSHRSPAFVISPYTRRGIVDGTMYNTASMLRTMELILGLPPLTQFDAAAQPMWNGFQAEPDGTPYSAELPQVDVNARNRGTGGTAARSAKLDFSRPDAIDDRELNEILWLELRGTPVPAPRRSFLGRGR